MGTPFDKINDAFLSKILEDEYGQWTIDEMKCDMRQLMESAIPFFKFPRVSLERDDNGFKEELGSEEIQIIATYMKCEWLNRCIMTWENVKTLYDERDFSQANLLKSLEEALENERNNALRLESIYYRSVKGKPFQYSKLAGANYGTK